jgi:hypothetical protein
MYFPIERRNLRSRAIPCAFLVLLVAGCSSGSNSTGGGGGAGTANVFFTDANNYSSMSSLTLPSITTASGTDLTICWDQIMKDLQCHSVTPLQDIDNVDVLAIPNSDAGAIEAELAAGTLQGPDLHSINHFLTNNASTCAKLSQFSFAGAAINVGTDYVASPNMQYMVLFASGTTDGVGSRTMAFLDPSPSSTNTMVEAPDGCGILNFQANLESLTPLPIPKMGPWVMDWSQLTRDSINNTVIFSKIDSLLLGYYPGLQVSDLQMQFLNIQQIANPLYQMSVDGAHAQSANLANAKDANGNAFSGFTSTSGTWAVGLLCSSCQNPAPIALTILNPQ